MAVRRLNHAVLYVHGLQQTVDFYRAALGFEVRLEIPGRAAFLRAPGSANDHDLGLFDIGTGHADGGPRVGLYHLAWEVDTLHDLEVLAQALSEAGALVGASDHSTTKSLYGHDPDGIEFEIAWLIPAHLITEDAVNQRGVQPLDIAAEQARYGAETKGGIGVSVPA